MPKQACISMRPGTLFGYKGEVYRVLHNDTLNMRFQAKRIEPKHLHQTIKTFPYMAGQEITVRWIPFDQR